MLKVATNGTSTPLYLDDRPERKTEKIRGKKDDRFPFS